MTTEQNLADRLEEKPAVIKGEGFNPSGGGFARIIVDGVAYTSEQVRSALRSRESEGWRTIDSAPKDGRTVLGAYFNQPRAESHREGRIVKCWYQPEFESFISGCREMTLASGYTFEDGTSRQLHSPDKEDITHWMPLPPPPQDRAMIKAVKGGE